MNMTPELRCAIRDNDILNAVESTVIESLIFYANEHSLTCYPRINRLVKEAKKSIRTVRRALRSLELKGVIKCDPQYRDDGSQTSNLYTLNLDSESWGKSAHTEPEKCKKNERTPLPTDSVRYSRNNLSLNNSDIIFDSDNKSSENSCQYVQQRETAHQEPKKHEISKRTGCFSQSKKNFGKNTISDNKTRRVKINDSKIISMEQIKRDFGYAELVKGNETKLDIIEPMFNAISKVYNTPDNEPVKINKRNVKSKSWVMDKLKSLELEDLKAVIDRIATGAKEIKNLGSYILTCLIDYISSSSINLRREVNSDMALFAVSQSHRSETPPAEDPGMFATPDYLENQQKSREDAFDAAVARAMSGAHLARLRQGA